MKEADVFPKTRTKFIEVKCPSCENSQMVFSNPSKAVKCNVCATDLVEPTGGKGRIRAKSQKKEEAQQA